MKSTQKIPITYAILTILFFSTVKTFCGSHPLATRIYTFNRTTVGRKIQISMPNNTNGSSLTVWGWVLITNSLAINQRMDLIRIALESKDGAGVPESYQNMIKLNYLHYAGNPPTGTLNFEIASSDTNYIKESMPVVLKPNVWVFWSIVIIFLFFSNFL